MTDTNIDCISLQAPIDCINVSLLFAIYRYCRLKLNEPPGGLIQDNAKFSISFMKFQIFLGAYPQNLGQ